LKEIQLKIYKLLLTIHTRKSVKVQGSHDNQFKLAIRNWFSPAQ